MDAKLADCLGSLILIVYVIEGGVIRCSEYNQAIVANILDKGCYLFKSFIFVIIFEEVEFLIQELDKNVVQEAKGVGQILAILVKRRAHANNLLHFVFLSQVLEQVFVLTEFLEDGTGVESHVDVVLVLLRELVNEEIDNH